jgi:hypothetical protein
MAAYQGTRAGGLVAPRSPGLGLLPGPGPAVGSRPAAGATRPAVGATTLRRRRARPAFRAGHRRLTVGSLLAGIALVFVVAFFSLAQAVRVSAANYEVDRLALTRDRLEARQRELLSDLNRLGSEPAIRKLAFDSGLGQLDTPIVLPAR